MVSKLKNMRSFMKVFSKDEDGATAIEYGLFAALIGAAIVATVGLLGGDLNTTFVEIRSAFTGEEAGGN
ncbi:Flp family type IVb pilin [Sulfitobacter sp. NFXS29]|uniref:Flp family type IVb pilin n=1 Tax=Sulfitobacter sp. NFXS29 TaxID=2818438 RepID=UPI0032DF08DD